MKIKVSAIAFLISAALIACGGDRSSESTDAQNTRTDSADNMETMDSTATDNMTDTTRNDDSGNGGAGSTNPPQ